MVSGLGKLLIKTVESRADLTVAEKAEYIKSIQKVFVVSGGEGGANA